MAGSKQEPSPSLGDRLFAYFMWKVGPKAEWRFVDRKLRLFEPLRGTVVEVGMGPAPNLKLYAQHVDEVIGVDCNVAMHGYARQAAEAAHAADKLRLITGRAEALPLEDGSADAVVMTHVLCTVSDQRQALSEARRVLKPGGRLVFLEHVAAPQGQWLHTMQHALNPAVGFFGHGCSCCRDTLAAIRSAGFAVVDADEFTLPIWGPLAVIGPHISGVARK